MFFFLPSPAFNSHFPFDFTRPNTKIFHPSSPRKWISIWSVFHHVGTLNFSLHDGIKLNILDITVDRSTTEKWLDCHPTHDTTLRHPPTLEMKLWHRLSLSFHFVTLVLIDDENENCLALLFSAFSGGRSNEKQILARQTSAERRSIPFRDITAANLF